MRKGWYKEPETEVLAACPSFVTCPLWDLEQFIYQSEPNCRICNLVVMDYYLPGRALVLINKVRMKYRSSALAHSRCQIEMLILFFEMWFLLPT